MQIEVSCSVCRQLLQQRQNESLSLVHSPRGGRTLTFTIANGLPCDPPHFVVMVGIHRADPCCGRRHLAWQPNTILVVFPKERRLKKTRRQTLLYGRNAQDSLLPSTVIQSLAKTLSVIRQNPFADRVFISSRHILLSCLWSSKEPCGMPHSQ